MDEKKRGVAIQEDEEMKENNKVIKRDWRGEGVKEEETKGTQSANSGMNEGQRKKEFALRFAERYLKEHGLEVELDVVSDMIEAQLIKFLMQARLRLAAAG